MPLSCIPTMKTKPQRAKGSDGALSLLNAAINALELARNAPGTIPTEDAFSSASTLLATIRDSMINKAEWVELGLLCADICQSALRAIEQLVMIVAEIQRYIVRQGKRNSVSRYFRARGDAKAAANWRLDLEETRPAFDSGGIRLSTQWKQLELSLHREDQYVPPIGVVRLWLNKATDVKNVKATLGGKSDPYVRVLVDDVIVARTEVVNNSLNPVWNQVLYVPVHSPRETLFLECMDYQCASKDRFLGCVELHLNELAAEADSKEYPYMSTGKTAAAAYLEFEKDIFSGQLHYEAEFFPALALKDFGFGTGSSRIRQAANDNVTNGEGGSISSSDVEGETVPAGITTRGPLSVKGRKSNVKNAVYTDTGPRAGDESNTKSSIESPAESVDKNSSGKGVVTPKGELMQHQSGVIVFNVTTARLMRIARLEVSLDDARWPAFTTPMARSRNVTWNYTGEGFIKGSDSSCVWLRLNEADEGTEDNIVAVWKEDAKKLLQETMDGTVKRTLHDQDGKAVATVRLEARYIPVPLKMEPMESIGGRPPSSATQRRKDSCRESGSQVVCHSSLRSRNPDYDPAKALDKTFKGHMDSLFLPQDIAPPSPGNGVCVPQRRYIKGTGRDNPDNRGRILFLGENGLYLPVVEAIANKYGDLMDQNSPVLCEVGYTVMIRFEWPGYPSKEYQLRTVDWCDPPKKITLCKLATEVAKQVRKFMDEMQKKQIDPSCALWRVGEGGVRVEDLRLGAFEQVSAGSWQARLFYMRPH